jgi:hypothetical protein
MDGGWRFHSLREETDDVVGADVANLKLFLFSTVPI